ncbi:MULTISPECIES: pilus assembly protein PilZ [unclassified Sulfitobacter]|jgi:hypothetical protein|uniref:pilus assembly protein PilZ n=1 Tax=unclassified Sulfitobacter TaxID=196795 RepID=UPI001594DACE|nr:pilus assembly protein PilZ [Sulfitobacter sp. HGT1]MBQ0803459.1 pilus assembly protein PilZ [Sulfitobacter sp.]
MTTNENGTPTPAKVIDLATEQVALPAVTLIGIFGSLEDPGALVRDRNGRIRRVKLGDAIAGGTVAAISDNAIVIGIGSKAKVLQLPKS